MKALLRLRNLLQFFVFLSIILIIGSIGAWETGSINFLQLLLQLAIFSATGVLSAKCSRMRLYFLSRDKRRPVRRHIADAVRSCRPAHAA